METSIAYSLGFGSGIDTASLVDDLARASREPKIALLEDKVTDNQAKISSLASLSSALENFTSSLAEVVDEGSFRTQPTVSDSSILSVKLTGDNNIGELSSKLTVHSLAAGQTLYSALQSSKTDAIGQGDIKLTVGSTDYTITIDGTNDSLEGLADAINAADSGVNASVVKDGSGYRLVLKGETGLENAFTLAADTLADPNLQNFDYSGSPGTGMTLGQAAADATFEIDGLMLSRSSNSVNDVLPGVSLTLLKADATKPVTIGTERQSEQLKSTLDDFISVYNTVWSTMISSREEFGSEYGVRQFERDFAGITTEKLTSHASINKLNDIGIYTKRDGTIALDSNRLEAALAADPDAVEALFHPPTGSGVDEDANPGISGVMDKLKAKMLDNDGMLAAVKERLEQVSKQYEEDLDRIEAREAAYRERLEKQFGSMDARISGLKATQSYLEQQIQIWNGNGS